MNDDMTITREMLDSILSGTDALITVCEHKTFDVLFLNEAIRKRFGIEGSGIGHKCYKILQKRDEPCVGCPYDQLRLDKTLTWEHKETVSGAVLLKNAKLIRWPGNKTAHLEFAVDISELRNMEKKNSELTKEVRRDPLTGMYNRRYFDETMEEVVAAAKRENHSVGMMMADIDHFKQYNDAYGHPQGDECLKQIARILETACTRKTDFAARYGGEEFVIVLPGITAEGLERVAERLLARIRAANIPHPEGIVTVSVGAVVDSNKSKDELLEAADKLLYKAKEAGRDRFRIE